MSGISYLFESAASSGMPGIRNNITPKAEITVVIRKNTASSIGRPNGFQPSV